MIIRNSLYTVFNGQLLRFYAKESKYCLVYNGVTQPDPSFVKEFEEIYVKTIEKEELKNSFNIKTKCQYNGFIFDIENNNGKSIRVLTEDSLAYKTLKLDIRDRGMFQTVIQLDDIEKLWEERTISHLHNEIPNELIFEKLDLSYMIEKTKIEATNEL